MMIFTCLKIYSCRMMNKLTRTNSLRAALCVSLKLCSHPLNVHPNTHLLLRRRRRRRKGLSHKVESLMSWYLSVGPAMLILKPSITRRCQMVHSSKSKTFNQQPVIKRTSRIGVKKQLLKR